MDNTDPTTTLGKRNRGRPRKYPTHEEKLKADAKQKRARRQETASAQRDILHANFYNAPFHQEPGGALGWANAFTNPHSQATPTGVSGLNSMDISEFLPPASPPPMGDIEEQAISDIGVTTDAVDAFSMPNYESPNPNINFDAASHTSPETEDDEQDPVRHLAHELTEQLIKFQGCYNNCHQAAECNRTEDPNKYISLAIYLEFAPELGSDILGSATIAHQKDNLAGKIDTITRREMFCGIDSRGKIPCLYLSKDNRVTDNARVSFNIDSIIAFPSCLSVAKQGI
ncbi:hypothetical protein AUP68_08422 [Ilyonectria robusta]